MSEAPLIRQLYAAQARLERLLEEQHETGRRPHAALDALAEVLRLSEQLHGSEWSAASPARTGAPHSVPHTSPGRPPRRSPAPAARASASERGALERPAHAPDPSESSGTLGR